MAGEGEEGLIFGYWIIGSGAGATIDFSKGVEGRMDGWLNGWRNGCDGDGWIVSYQHLILDT